MCDCTELFRRKIVEVPTTEILLIKTDLDRKGNNDLDFPGIREILIKLTMALLPIHSRHFTLCSVIVLKSSDSR